jgi:CheY-like chemotaxis protein
MAILVVDDSRAMRMIVIRELRKAGFDTSDVLEAENGRVALERIKERDVDLVLADWNMPDLNGMGLLKILRREGNDVPFGFVTSESTPLMHRDALDAGADFVVTKPFSADSLSLQVERVLEGRRQADGLGAAIAPEKETLASVLTDLLGRPVSTSSSSIPYVEGPGAVARYRGYPEGRRALFVTEMEVAVSVGAALSRVPPGAAKDYVEEGEFPEVIEQAFHEALNVLSKVVPGDEERWAFQGMKIHSKLVDHSEVRLAARASWWPPVEVSVSGYPSGRAGFLRT